MCNVCSKKFKRKFSPLPEYYTSMLKKHGYKYSVYDAETLNVNVYTCPSCGCNDRERLYALFLDSELVTTRIYSLLDFAPSHQLRKFLKSKANIIYRSADLMMEDVDDKVDITEMKNYQDNSFDIFICSHVLEHVNDDIKAMRELKRILKRGGFGILMVPIVLTATEIDEDITITEEAERWRRFGQEDHVRCYSKKGFLERLSISGFSIQELGVEHFGKDLFRHHGISYKSVLYVVQ